MADVRPAVWSEEIDRIIAQGTDAELQTLRGVPGVRFDPVTWQEISTAARGNDVASLSRVGRNPRQLRVYRQFKEKVLSQYASLGDYIRELILHHETRPREGDGKLVAVGPPAAEASATSTSGSLTSTCKDSSSARSAGAGGGKSEESGAIWGNSDFPYYLADGLQHNIVWCPRPLADGELQQFVRQHRQGWEYVTWVNPPALASIPSVWHAHCVSRPTNGDAQPLEPHKGLHGALRRLPLAVVALALALGLAGRVGNRCRNASNPV